MSRSTILRLIDRMERIADNVPVAHSIDQLTALGSQFMGTAMAAKEQLEGHGISTDSPAMHDLLKSFDTPYKSDQQVVEERWRLQASIHQIASYSRALAEKI